jgi:hypothetical protein
MVIIGVDVGLTGAAAAIEVGEMGGISLIEIIDLPSEPIGTKRRIHVEVLGRWLEKTEPDLAIIENVHSMPNDGASRSFRFGGACEAVRATVALYAIRYRMIAPQTWKPWAGLPTGSEKDASRDVAIRMCPASAPFLKRKLDHNRGDAVLLALYGAKQ